MAKKKLKLKQLKKDKRFKTALPGILVAVGVLLGLLVAWIQPPDLFPRVAVWKAEASVVVPPDLAEFLRSQKDDCAHYRGTDSPRGVVLWGIFQTSQNKFAKMTWGCSTNLDSYIVSVKDKGVWKFLPPPQYFASEAASTKSLPKCEYIDRYHMSKSFESFCIEVDGHARENTYE